MYTTELMTTKFKHASRDVCKVDLFISFLVCISVLVILKQSPSRDLVVQLALGAVCNT